MADPIENGPKGPDKEPKMVDLSTEEYTQKLAEAPVYAKFGTVEARVAAEQEVVETILTNGTVETTNTAEVGDVIVTNPGGEKYVLKPEKFANKYEATEQDGVFRAKGIARAINNPEGCDIKIMAPWGEEQKGGPDCMVVIGFDPSNPSEISPDRYIIGGDEFKATYAPYEEVYGKPAPVEAE